MDAGCNDRSRRGCQQCKPTYRKTLHTKKVLTMHAHRFGMNFEETIVGKLTEVYQTVHLKEFTDFLKKDEKDPTTVITDIHFEKKSVAYEAYHLSHGFCQ